MATKKLSKYVDDAGYLLPSYFNEDFNEMSVKIIIGILLSIKDELEISNEYLKVISKMGEISKP